MFRIRRYRVYAIIAAIGLLLLYQMTQETDWEALTKPIDYTSDATRKTEAGSVKLNTEDGDIAGSLGIQRKRPQQEPLGNEEKEEKKVKLPELKEPEALDAHVDYTLPATTVREFKTEPTVLDETTKQTSAGETSSSSEPPVVILPDRKTPHQKWEEDAAKARLDEEKLRAQKPVKQGFKTSKKPKPTSTIHWQKPTEIFTIAPESIISLPTGNPKTIPRVQHVFTGESDEARQLRENRLAKVKSEMNRAWTGYKTYAWMHDELSPVTEKFRDPFCGWAATLVDSLDTLWIMGMKEEFEDAVKAVAGIDFTLATRTEIPVFETTIRYLGGFLAAYDVSGGKEGGHEILLEKAVELAEILMGVFDTPNRMPVLYYNWKPASMSVPRRATSGGVAELGSLLMEFTRLAQLTKENKYYDAVARITDAFEEWQSRPGGTSIAGIFPENIDTTGCNRTAAAEAQLKLTAEQQAEVQSLLPGPDDYTGREYSGKKKGRVDKTSGPEPARPDKATRVGTKSPTGHLRRGLDIDVDEDLYDHPSTIQTGSIAQTQKEITAPLISNAPDMYQQMRMDKITAAPYTLAELPDVCYPQGLTSGGWGRDSYGMGGSQDSTYEYFPKQFLLLGGLEPKYRTMHEKVVSAVKQWLLYRPMVPDNRDILFSAKVSTTGKPEIDLLTEYEVTHLTCFLGGMFAMAGKIFEDGVDVEIGRKLTDGCVWAYESMATGIMPEAASVVPCADASNCKWNETLWHQYLDPLWDSRDKQVESYLERKAAAKAEAKAQAEKAKAKVDAALLEAEAELDDPTEADEKAAKPAVSLDLADLAEMVDEMSTYNPNQKRGVALETMEDDRLETSSNDNIPPAKTTQKPNLGGSMGDIVTGSGSIKVSKPLPDGSAQVPLTSDEDDEDPTKPDPSRPFTHEEYVKSRIESEHIPPGFATVNSKHYILRPEAIESVWYMYRITGDTTWQDKGWKMFESIIAATQTESGHSAIANVMTPGSDRENAMESFWLAETLKYFYLLYATPDVISLDEWVLNTEAHPFKRPQPA